MVLHQCDNHGSRLTVGRALHGTLFLLCSRTLLLIYGMLSALSQIILANVVFLISCSMAALNAVRSVFKLGFGAFSCQKRSPTLRRRNCSATMHWKVGPRTPPSLGLGSSIPRKGEQLKVKLVSSMYLNKREDSGLKLVLQCLFHVQNAMVDAAFVCLLNEEVQDSSPVADLGEGPRGPAPLIIKFLGDRPTHISGSGWPPPLIWRSGSTTVLWNRHCYQLTISRRRGREYRRIVTETKSRWLFANIHVAWGD